MKLIVALSLVLSLAALPACGKKKGGDKAAAANKELGAECKADGECKSGLNCVSLKILSDKCADKRVCTKKDCKTNKACPMGYSCWTQGMGRACFEDKWKSKNCK